MRRDTLAILRCPYCGGRLQPIESTIRRAPLRQKGDIRTSRGSADVPLNAESAETDISDGVLRCHCSLFPVVAGIAVMMVEGVADTAREQIEEGNSDLAAQTMFAGGDEDIAQRFAHVAEGRSATYRDTVNALGPAFVEARYFLYRFSDPTFLVAEAVVRTLAETVLHDGGRAIDLCGGSGHLTRTLLEFPGPPPVLLDWSFAKLWLARRFTAPGCEAVCSDGHSALPFASRAFRLAVCSDAFHYIWTKRLLAAEMLRLTGDRGAVALTHAHNKKQPNQAAGMPLPPAGYRDLFEEIDSQVFAERRLLEEVINGGIDLSRRDGDDALDRDPALTVIASAREDVFRKVRLAPSSDIRGELRVNPLYAVTMEDERAALRLTFPSEEYEEEYRACRLYLPETLSVTRSALTAVQSGLPHPDLAELISRRIVLDLPKGYY